MMRLISGVLTTETSGWVVCGGSAASARALLTFPPAASADSGIFAIDNSRAHVDAFRFRVGPGASLTFPNPAGVNGAPAWQWWPDAPGQGPGGAQLVGLSYILRCTSAGVWIPPMGGEIFLWPAAIVPPAYNAGECDPAGPPQPPYVLGALSAPGGAIYLDVDVYAVRHVVRGDL